jgi:ABC-type transporter Mla MlaB component
MIRIEIAERSDVVTFALSGRLQTEDLPELIRIMEVHCKPVALDLTGVKLIDREAITFLAHLETNGATITHCPAYIREWIVRERRQP